MAIPQLTEAQQFQNSVNAVPISLNQNLNPANQQGVTGLYTRNYNAIFKNANGTPAQAIANLGTGAANILNLLSGLYAFLNGAGVVGLNPVPAYTANTDGTVTLTATPSSGSGVSTGTSSASGSTTPSS